MMDICILLLESARRYSALADEAFRTSVQQSHFANGMVSKRMTWAKIFVQKQINFEVTLTDEQLEIFNVAVEPGDLTAVWESCLNLDFILLALIEKEELSPVAMGLQLAIEHGKTLLEVCKEDPKKSERWKCLNCGAVVELEKDTESMPCPVCDMGENWQIALPNRVIRHTIIK